MVICGRLLFNSLFGGKNMRISFNRHLFRATIKYVCKKCGHKMYRVSSSYYTNNPWNTMPDAQCWAQIKMDVYENTKPCPKCDHECGPVLSDLQKREYKEAKKIVREFKREGRK